MTDKQHAHDLLDRLPADQFAAILHLLEVMIDPVIRSIEKASVEEEEITSKTAATLDKARTSLERGEGVSHEDLMREFGLTPRS